MAKAEEYIEARGNLLDKETELMLLLSKSEALNMSIVDMLKICNEPLLIAYVLHRGRFSRENTSSPRSIIEIYSRVSRISYEIRKSHEGRREDEEERR